MESVFKNNQIYLKLPCNTLGFLDTGGGYTFLFRRKELLPKLKKYTRMYRREERCEYFPKNVILFISQDFFWNKIIRFNYPKKKLEKLTKAPVKGKRYKMYSHKNNSFSHVDVIIDGDVVKLLFDTGATRDKNGKIYGTSFLDGALFDKLAKKYKTIPKYDDDGQPGVVVPEIEIFGKKLKNVKFLRRNAGNFSGWMSKVTKVKHIGAIGGNVLKNFNIVADFKNNKFIV